MAGNEYMTGYQAYETDTEDDPPSHSANEDEEAPVFVHSHDKNPTERWHHIENLDDFFNRIYTYHQRHGLLCMMTEDILQLVQFLLMVLFTGFLVDCVNYDILFATKTPTTKQTLHDVFITPCSCGFSQPMVALCMLIAFAFLLMRMLLVIFNIFKYWEIRLFYQIALGIKAGELDNTTWFEVQSKLMHVQKDIQMCIYKNELTQLDIYHRILRYKNFFISMVNKSVLPLKLRLPFMGEISYLTHGLKYNLEWILFWKPLHLNISPFKNPYYVKEEYKSVHKRIALSKQLSNRILVVGLVNLLLSPLIFLWHILYFIFVYGNMMKRDPSFLGSRKWSLHSRSYLRHFNELDHELNSRLCQAYQVSKEYMNGFMSPLPAILGRFVTFVVGAVLFVLVCLTWYDEDVLQIQHMITVMGGCGMLLAMSSVFIPPENMVFVPETKMTQILAHTHYQPHHWKDKAHTSQVRDEFGELFQFKAITLVHELLSPLVTPLYLIFKIRPRSLDIVDFYRNFSVDVAGVGDICSFAQLDIRRHGNRKWSATGAATADTYQQAELGKTELSLMHFSLMNPSWTPPEEGGRYLASIRESAEQDASLGATNLTPLTESLLGLPQSGGVPLGESTSHMGVSSTGSAMFRSAGPFNSVMRHRRMAGSVSQHAGPSSDTPAAGGSVMAAVSKTNSLEGRMSDRFNSSEYNSNEMSISVLYMHELQRRNQLSNIGQIGYENLESVRQVMTDSELHPVSQFQSVNEEYESPSASQSSSHYSASEQL